MGQNKEIMEQNDDSSSDNESEIFIYSHSDELQDPQRDEENQYVHWTSRWPRTAFTQEVINIVNTDRAEEQYIPVDGKDPVEPNGPSNTSKTQFCQAIRSVGAQYNWSIAGLNQLFGVIKDHTSLDVPVTTREGKQTKQYHWNKYIPTNPANFRIDCCMKNCCAFIAGKQEEIKCSECGSFRYSACGFGGRGNCPDGQNCSPFINKSHKYRNAHQVMFYRSIIHKLMELYKRSLSTEFKDILNYNERRKAKAGFLYDIIDGVVVKEEMETMHKAFAERAALYASENNGAVLHECSLGLSVFYDGDTLFKRASDSMWNMFVSVVNCDPSFRTKLGLGLFLAIMHNLPVGSGAEQDVIDHLYSEELKQLENGIVFEFLIDGEPHAVFLQARVVFLHLDTRAVDSFLHCQTAGSMCGCPFCYACTGLTRSILGARIYVGSTCLSHPQHVMRTLGQSKETPSGYFGDLGIEVNKALGKKISDEARTIVLRGRFEKEDGNGDDDDSDGGDNSSKQQKKKKKKVVKTVTSYNHPRSTVLPEGLVWENGDFPYEWFAPAIYMPHNDDRVMSMTRVTIEKYMERKAVAVEQRDQYLSECSRLGKEPAKNKCYAFEGVHPTTSAWMECKSPRFNTLTNDPMHSVGGMYDYYVESITGERANTDACRKLAAYQKRFLSWVKDKGKKPPYKASNDSICMLDTVMYSMNVPTQYSGDYWFGYPFRGKGHMNMHQKITFMISYMTYLISFLDITKPYKYYFRRVSNDLQRMFNPILEIRRVDKLQRDVVETTMLHEGMYPCSEQAFIKHEIVEITHSIKNFGILNGMMTSFGERANKFVSDSVTAGGNKYIISTNASYMAKESSFDDKYKVYKKNAAAFTDNMGLYSTTTLRMTGSLEKVSLNNFIKDILFSDILEFLMSQEIDDLTYFSPFVRLFYTYTAITTNERLQEHLETQQIAENEFPSSFTTWLEAIYSAYSTFTANFNADEALKGIVCGVIYEEDDDYQVAALKQLAADKGKSIGAVVTECMCDCGYIYFTDITGIILDLARFGAPGAQTIASFTSATVKGVPLRGRGYACSEKSVVLETFTGTNKVGLAVEYIVQNESNVLAKNWSDSAHFSSFFRATDYYIKHPNDRRRRKVEEKVRFGQVNYFFRLFVPSDPVINGLPFANVTLRKAVYDKQRWHYKIDVDDRISYDGSKQFIPLNYFNSTAIATSVMDPGGLPMLNPASVMRYSRKAIKEYPLKFSKEKADKAKNIYLVELHPERFGGGFEYETVAEDKDGTKVFEEVVKLHHEKQSI